MLTCVKFTVGQVQGSPAWQGAGQRRVALLMVSQKHAEPRERLGRETIPFGLHPQ